MQLHLSENTSLVWPAGREMPLALRDALLLAWLAVEGPTERGRLAGLLWPASDEGRARTALRQRLFQLRRTAGRDLVAGQSLLSLAEGVSHDLAASPQLLGGLQCPEMPDLDAWLQRQRGQRRDLERNELARQSTALEAQGNLDAALGAAQALLRLEPLDEPAHQRLIRLHYLRGDRAAALAAFAHCERLLDGELGVRPAPPTLALRDLNLRAAPAAPASAPMLPPQIRRPPRQVARGAAQQALADALWAQGLAQLIGEAGIGKSRLLAEAADVDPHWLTAPARPGDAACPYATLERLLHALAPLHGAVPPPRGQSGAQAWAEALAAWLEAAPSPVTLALDDLQFADDATLELLPGLVTARQSRRWVLSHRPAAPGSALQRLLEELAAAGPMARIELQPLAPGEVAELIDELGLNLDTERLAPALARRCGGNPLFVLETLKQGWLDGSLGDIDAPCPEPPASLRQLLGQRLAQLSRPALALARVAAVAGACLEPALAAAVLELPAAELADPWHELEAAQLLAGSSFTHELLREAALASLVRPLAAHYHGLIAAWLEAHGGEPAAVAQHWQDAGQPLRALPGLAQAAERAAQALRNREALGFLERKAELEHAAGLQGQAFESLLHACEWNLDLDTDTATTERRFQRLADWACGPEQACRARTQRATLEFRRLLPAAAMLSDCAAEAATLGLTELAMSCTVMLGLAWQREGQARQALKALDDSAGWIARHGSAMRRGEWQLYRGTALASLGQVDAGLAHNAEALRIARELGTAHYVITVLNHRAQMLLAQGRAGTALATIDEGLHLSARHEASPMGARLLACHQLDALLALDRLREMQACISRWGTAALQRLPQGAGVRALVIQQNRLGRPQEAARLAREALALPQYPLMRAWLQAHAEGLETPAAEALLRSALQGGVSDLRWLGRLTLAHARSGDAEDDAARRLRRDALQGLLDAPGSAGLPGLVLQAEAMLAALWRADDPARAAGHARRALQLADDFDTGELYRGELYLNAILALRAAGGWVAARMALGPARLWLEELLADDLPDELRDDFLQLNPCNRELLALLNEAGFSLRSPSR